MKTRTKKLLGYTIVGGCVPAVAGLIGCMATRAAHAADVTMPTKYLGQWCLANGGINDQFEYRRPTNSADFKTCSSMIVRVNGFFGSAAGDCKLVDIFPHVRVKGYNAIFNCNHDAYAHDGRSPELRSVWFGNYGPNTLTFEPNATAADEIKIERQTEQGLAPLSQLDNYCAEYGAGSSCRESAKNCANSEEGMPRERCYAAAAIVTCWDSGLRPGKKLDACIDRALAKRNK